MVKIIVAMDENGLIGQNSSSDGIPWKNPEDLKHFKDTTLGKTILMGATTYKAIGRPLSGRKTIVLSKKGLQDNAVAVCDSLEKIIEEYNRRGEDLYIAGGASVYMQALPYADELLISRIPGSFTGETYFPDFSGYNYLLKDTKQFETFILECYEKKK